MRKEFLKKQQEYQEKLDKLLKDFEEGRAEFDVEAITDLRARLMSSFDLEEALETANTNGPQKEPLDTLKVAHKIAKERNNSDVIKYLRSYKDFDYFMIALSSELEPFCSSNVFYGVSRHTGEYHLLTDQIEYGFAAGWE